MTLLKQNKNVWKFSNFGNFFPDFLPVRKILSEGTKSHDDGHIILQNVNTPRMTYTNVCRVAKSENAVEGV